MHFAVHMKASEIFKKNLTKWCKDRGFKAKLVKGGIQRNAIKKLLLKDHPDPRLSTIEKIAKVKGIKAADVLLNSENNSTSTPTSIRVETDNQIAERLLALDRPFNVDEVADLWRITGVDAKVFGSGMLKGLIKRTEDPFKSESKSDEEMA